MNQKIIYKLVAVSLCAALAVGCSTKTRSIELAGTGAFVIGPDKS